MQGSASVTINGEKVGYQMTGNGSSKVVMVHGNSQRADTFSSLIARLPTNQYQCICVDLPGHGDSPPSNHPESCYSLPGYANLMISLVDA